MFWIQETGTNKNNSNYRLFYAESKSDIDLLPTNSKYGTQSNGDSVANHICALGSECFCLEDGGSLYILTTSGWVEV